MQNTQYLPPNLSEKILQLGLHASIFDPVRLFAIVRLLGTRETAQTKTIIETNEQTRFWCLKQK